MTPAVNPQAPAFVEEINQSRDRQTVGLLRIFALYRLLVSAILLLLLRQGSDFTRLGQADPETFATAVQIYAVINLLILVAVNFLPRPLLGRSRVITLIVGFDTLVIAWFAYLSGGINGNSGLAPLMLVAVAAGAILAASRVSIFLAALATIALLYEESYLAFEQNASFDGVFQAGVFGVLFFTVAMAILTISRRLRESELVSITQAAELADLERVNRQIIQRMRTGILVVDDTDSVRMGNQSAYSLLGMGTLEEQRLKINTSLSPLPELQLPDLPQPLAKHMQDWRENTNYRTRPFQVNGETPEIRINFSAVRANEPDGDVIVFIEDTGEIQQQAQQLKLAALGRLSASIAHEIRNPLGAIAHAAQLLNESEHIDRGDTRLIDIINDHSKRMNSVIENILELSRRKAPNPTRLQLSVLLEEFVAQFCVAELENAEITITIRPTDAVVRMDRSQLLQVLTNLAQNGLRYSFEHTGKLALILQGGIDTTTDRPYLNVLDHGPGVPEENRATLFEPFFTTEHSGTGLGLYIAREMCEANQARLSYVAVPDAGACFRITFAHPDRITV